MTEMISLLLDDLYIIWMVIKCLKCDFYGMYAKRDRVIQRVQIFLNKTEQ